MRMGRRDVMSKIIIQDRFGGGAWITFRHGMGRQKGTPFPSRKFLLRTALPEHFYGFRLGQRDGYGIFSDLQGGSGRHLGGSIHDRENGVTYFIHVCQYGLGKRVHVPHDLASPIINFSNVAPHNTTSLNSLD